jgi:hypothetical protein
VVLATSAPINNSGALREQDSIYYHASSGAHVISMGTFAYGMGLSPFRGSEVSEALQSFTRDCLHLLAGDESVLRNAGVSANT